MFHPGFGPRQEIFSKRPASPRTAPYKPLGNACLEMVEIVQTIDARLDAGDDPVKMGDILHDLLLSAIDRKPSDQVNDPFGFYPELIKAPEWELVSLYNELLTDEDHVPAHVFTT